MRVRVSIRDGVFFAGLLSVVGGIASYSPGAAAIFGGFALVAGSWLWTSHQGEADHDR